MEIKQWIELIKENREEIERAGLEAYEGAWRNDNMDRTVEISEKGELIINYFPTKSNSQSAGTFHGEALEIMRIETFGNPYDYEYIQVDENTTEEEKENMVEEMIHDDVIEYGENFINDKIDSCIAELEYLYQTN